MSGEYVAKDEFLEAIAELNGKAVVSKGSLEILIGYIGFKQEEDKFNNFLQHVAASDQFTADAREVAKQLLQLESAFGRHVLPPNATQQ